MMKRYFVDAAVMAGVFLIGLLGLEAFHTWQRVNAMWGWVNEQNARMVQAQRAEVAAQPAPALTESPKKP